MNLHTVYEIALGIAAYEAGVFSLHFAYGVCCGARDGWRELRRAPRPKMRAGEALPFSAYTRGSR